MLTQQGATLLLQVKVVPNSSRSQLAGSLGAALKIKVAQPPEDGRANHAVLQLLAEILQIPSSHLTLAAGRTRPYKTFHIHGLDLATAQARLTAAMDR